LEIVVVKIQQNKLNKICSGLVGWATFAYLPKQNTEEFVVRDAFPIP
jgi:hypothetical protein